jgi:diacylglycerol kinase family enzyme
MPVFSQISIIYNPISTGPGEAMARDLRRKLKKALPKTPVDLIETQYARHAEKLAYDLAKNSNTPLIISASGDGSYNEVVNGALQAQSEGASPITGLLPSGNANDHYANLHSDDLVEEIVRGHVQTIDVLELHGVKKRTPFRRYAHSYIGFGLTPEIGVELNKTKLNVFREVIIVVKGLFDFSPVKIERNGKTRTYDSIVMSNVRTMSKYLTLSKSASVTDGRFELTTFRKRSKYYLLSKLIAASTTGLEDPQTYKRYSFRTLHQLNVQLDGEIHRLDTKTTVTVIAHQKKLRCVI